MAGVLLALEVCMSVLQAHREGVSLYRNTCQKDHEERSVHFGSQLEGSQSIMVGKAWLQEHEGAGHMAATVRKQREVKVGAQ